MRTAAHELQQLVGHELMERICERFAGELIYIPMRPPVDPADVRLTFDATLPGAASVMSAYEETAAKYDVTPRTVRRWLASVSNS